MSRELSNLITSFFKYNKLEKKHLNTLYSFLSEKFPLSENHQGGNTVRIKLRIAHVWLADKMDSVSLCIYCSMLYIEFFARCNTPNLAVTAGSTP